MSFNKFIAASVVLGFAGSALAIDGTDATGVVSVTELVSQLGSNQYQYTYTFSNVSATSGIWYVGIYSDFAANSISSATFSIDGNNYSVGTSQVTGGFADANNTPTGFSSVIYGYTGEASTNKIAEGDSGTLSFIEQGASSAPSFNPGSKLFFAELSGNGATIDSNGSMFSYVGSTPPTPAPEPSVMALLGVVGLGIAVARRRTA